MHSPVELEVSLPTIEDYVNLAVTFPSGSTMADGYSTSDKKGISCYLEFSSTQPISKSDYIIFCDKTSGKRYTNRLLCGRLYPIISNSHMDCRKRIPFTVVADNSLFTVYTFLAQNINSASVRLKNGHLPSLLLQPRYCRL